LDWTLIISVVAIVSLAVCVLGVVTAPFMVARLKKDTFTQERMRRVEAARARRGHSRGVWLARNIGGSVVILVALPMLIGPGQGVLTLVLGLVILDTRWKHRLVLRLTRPSVVRRGLNGLRRKMGREAFVFDGDAPPGEDGPRQPRVIHRGRFAAGDPL